MDSAISWLYTLPIELSFIIFIITFVSLSLGFLWLYKKFTKGHEMTIGIDSAVGLFLGVVSIFLGVLLSLIVVDTWTNYGQTRNISYQEANDIYLLYKVMDNMPDTETIKFTIIEYLNYIIFFEYPALAYGTVPDEGTEIINRLQNEIYSYQPPADKAALYGTAIGLLDTCLAQRITRIGGASFANNDWFIWIALLDSVMLLIMCCFINTNEVFHYILMTITSTYIATAIFLILIVSNPFRGGAKLTPLPFESALKNIELYP